MVCRIFATNNIVVITCMYESKSRNLKAMAIVTLAIVMLTLAVVTLALAVVTLPYPIHTIVVYFTNGLFIDSCQWDGYYSNEQCSQGNILHC